MSITTALLLILLCIALSAFFSAAEMSFSSASRVRLSHMAENGNRAARTATGILRRFDSALSAILIGNNLVNIAASSLGSLVAMRLAGEAYTWVSTVILTVAVVILGETVPKILAERNATRFALAMSKPVRLLMTALLPVTTLSVGVVRLLTFPFKGEKQGEDGEMAAEELHSIIETAEDEEVLDEETSELISAAIDFSEITAQEVMTARVDLEAVDLTDSAEEIRRTILRATVSRLPVYEDGIDHITGILHVNRYLKALVGCGDGEEPDLRSLLLPAGYVYKAMKLPAVLAQMQEEQQQIAVVTDEYGGTLGIVSIEDVLEELVGEIWDETDTIETEVIRREDGSVEVDGDMLLADLAEYMGWQEDGGFESDTVGGWCIEMLGCFPDAGASFCYEDSRITVMETEERRVLRLGIMKIKEEEQR